jgi:hypothetical protein
VDIHPMRVTLMRVVAVVTVPMDEAHERHYHEAGQPRQQQQRIDQQRSPGSRPDRNGGCAARMRLLGLFRGARPFPLS